MGICHYYLDFFFGVLFHVCECMGGRRRRRREKEQRERNQQQQRAKKKRGPKSDMKNFGWLSWVRKERGRKRERWRRRSRALEKRGPVHSYSEKKDHLQKDEGEKKKTKGNTQTIGKREREKETHKTPMHVTFGELGKCV